MSCEHHTLARVVDTGRYVCWDCDLPVGMRCHRTTANDTPEVLVEIRAAELAALDESHSYDSMSDVEFDWLVHGHWTPHSPTDSTPETAEELAGCLANWIISHDKEQS